MNNEKDLLEKELKKSKESHRTDLFFVYWVVGEILLGLLTGFDTWSFFIGSWILVWLAWRLAKKQID
jgi:hypothetical protein